MIVTRILALYVRATKAIRYVLFYTWIGMQNMWNNPYQPKSFFWLPFEMYAGQALFKTGPTSIILFLLGLGYIADIYISRYWKGKHDLLRDLKGLSRNERDAKIEEMWLRYNWIPLSPEGAEQAVEEAEEEKQPMLMDV